MHCAVANGFNICLPLNLGIFTIALAGLFWLCCLVVLLGHVAYNTLPRLSYRPLTITLFVEKKKGNIYVNTHELRFKVCG